MIRLKKVVKSYPVAGEDLVVLQDIDLQIKNGEFVAIMGPSGSGKSTLMNIIGCLDKPTSGEYLLNGKQVSAYDEKELAGVRNQSVGFVFQQFQLLPRLNALQNVELPMIYAGVGKKERIDRAQEALEKVGLGDRMDHLPNALSGGQKQRVAIARAIVNEPNIILADEPTGALDSKTGVQIMDMFTLLNKEGTTVILVTHEAEIASYANRTIFVRDGKLTSAGAVVDQESYEKLVASGAEEEQEQEERSITENEESVHLDESRGNEMKIEPSLVDHQKAEEGKM
ncbi:putative ABC transport system ATP-binding protein [Pseudogracilibacillus auburnensis]|uniref:Putative ABC transport system ATP-binding protein n=1 Tax=Pseudogracilibacillus auburnensis TaxID=1494959 RepID=A0A2V3W454_9BACI|nr:putative ABC transport system ATP-binding protein [Pseudogracilibacillus auburnensis]